MPLPVAVTLNELLLPEQIAACTGCVTIAGNVFTVSIAAFEMPGVVQPGFESWQRYLLLFNEKAAPVMLSVAAVAPE